MGIVCNCAGQERRSWQWEQLWGCGECSRGQRQCQWSHQSSRKHVRVRQPLNKQRGPLVRKHKLASYTVWLIWLDFWGLSLQFWGILFSFEFPHPIFILFADFFNVFGIFLIFSGRNFFLKFLAWVLVFWRSVFICRKPSSVLNVLRKVFLKTWLLFENRLFARVHYGMLKVD